MTDILEEHATTVHTCQHCRGAEGTHRLARHHRVWACLPCVVILAQREGWGAP